MITHIEVKNFKSLKNISLNIKGLNVLMGLNGMGKSSLIQTLLLLMQSDKLESRIIDLNDGLVKIGQGRDALYQFAEEDFILFGLTFNNQNKYFWKFSYEKDKDQLRATSGFAKDQMTVFRANTKKFQYISAERLGPQDLYEASSSVVVDKKQIGLFGEYAAYFINMYGNDYSVMQRIRHPKAKSDKLLAQANAWLGEISPGVTLNTKYVPDVNKVILDYQFDFGNTKTNSFRPKNVGFGISYVLPIVLSLLTAEENKIIIIENPESHIHPRGQAELGKLISLAASTKAQLFIETHSDHILNGIRVAVKENLVDRQNVNILYFDKETTEKEQFTKVKPIEIDRNGELKEYPKNFLDEWSNQLMKLV